MGLPEGVWAAAHLEVAALPVGCDRGELLEAVEVRAQHIPLWPVEAAWLENQVLRIDVAPPPRPPRTKWTRRVPPPVLIGHAASLTPY